MPGACGCPASKLAYQESEHHLAASTRHIVDGALVLTMDMIGETPTLRTAGERLCGDHFYGELSCGDFHLANDHPVG